MSRWFRSYADTHRNPKIAKLSDKDFRLWHHLLCIAAENDGVIPPAEDLKHMVRMRLDHCYDALRRFLNGGLLDPLDAGYTPRNWGERQYKSDTSTDRVRQFRAKRNVAGNVSETAPDTETDTESKGGGKPPSYAFFGQTIRLTPQHLERWRKTYHAISDLEAEMTTIDAWWQDQPPAERHKWFFRTAGMLNRKHQEILAAQKEAEDDPMAFYMP